MDHDPVADDADAAVLDWETGLPPIKHEDGFVRTSPRFRPARPVRAKFPWYLYGDVFAAVLLRLIV